MHAAESCRHLVVDLNGVEFIDSTALGMLVRAARQEALPAVQSMLGPPQRSQPAGKAGHEVSLTEPLGIVNALRRDGAPAALLPAHLQE
ncbi:STAS domain-containing protein [Actinoplanes sp. TRM 88003]|uniref:STAS domain-containing protein n=2 Tax=Paractinoplanes aksuensis TaxID=2939490 RepID=A0ABT1E787_9ACTN|nr:STAS domain-containing protein [Actinoplanes aksuensis]